MMANSRLAWQEPGQNNDLTRLLAGTHDTPHRFLGAHPRAQGGVVIRAFHPDASSAVCLLQGSAGGEAAGGHALPMQTLRPGMFEIHLAHASMPLRYRLRFVFADGASWETDDPYRFLPTVGELDQHLFNEGKHRRLWEILGAHPCRLDGVAGVAFAVWAPNAAGVSVVGEFCAWDPRRYPMRALGSSGIFELFVPGCREGDLYKYAIRTADGRTLLKTDPFAAAMEIPPDTASRVFTSRHVWTDAAWQAARQTHDPLRSPMAIYEVHLGSWARVPEEEHRPLSYREVAVKLVAHVQALGFNYIELLPVAEHPFTGSWGYQVSGYYAPTARYGTPDDLRYFVDYCHQHGIGVLLDWVPAHFPKDAFALAQFDGTALYEHADPRRGEHPDWGTLIFNYGRNEVRNFLIANALYWLEAFHIDGLRVDAVASMLYLDYSREAGAWLPNAHGGRENLDAVTFLQELNDTVRACAPGCLMIAEESTAWPGVTRAHETGGLGFTFKWNMGWMHDTLEFFRQDPVHRKYHQGQLVFAMVYEHSEHFIMPLSHDEVVHGKGALLTKMPGDAWQQRANLRLLLSYQYTRPGKKLLFMGTELASRREWNHDISLDWHLLQTPEHAQFHAFVAALGQLYQQQAPLWFGDPDHDGFYWIDHHDHENSVLSYVRQAQGQHVLIVLNLTPIPRDDYRIGVPTPGPYREIFNSDGAAFGGSGWATSARLHTEGQGLHQQPHALRLRLPPLGALILAPAVQ